MNDATTASVFKGGVAGMRKNTLMKLGGSLALCVAAVGAWAYYASAKPSYVLKRSAPLALAQLQKYYGISFTASPTDASKEPITAQQAVAAVNRMFVKPIAMSATFGYMTTNPNGNAVFIPPTTNAGQIDGGVVKHYPVWLVSQPNAHLFISGPALPPNATKQQIEKRNQLLNLKGSNYSFVDATNGQRFLLSRCQISCRISLISPSARSKGR